MGSRCQGSLVLRSGNTLAHCSARLVISAVADPWGHGLSLEGVKNYSANTLWRSRRDPIYQITRFTVKINFKSEPLAIRVNISVTRALRALLGLIETRLRPN